MDRTGKIGVALAIITLVVWQIFYSKEMERTRLAQEKVAAEAAAQAANAPAGTPGAGTENPAAPTAGAAASTAAPVYTGATPAPTAVVLAQSNIPKTTEVIEGSEAKWTFSNFGGGIERVELINHKAEGGTALILNEFGGIPIGALTESFETAVLEPYQLEVSADRKAVTFRRTDSRQLTIEKRFTLSAPSAELEKAAPYLWNLELRFINQSPAPVTVPAYALRTGAAAPLHIKDQPLYTGFNRMNSGSAKYTDINWFDGGGFLGFNRVPRLVYSESGQVQWIGVTNQYYSTIVSPVGDAATEALARRFSVEMKDWTANGRSGDGVPPRAVDGAVRYAATVLEPGRDLVRKSTIYAGPRELEILRELGGGQDQMLDFGMFGIVSKILLASMNALKGLLGSYAAAIIVLTIIIKLLMWPLQNKSTASMQRMQELQPKMNALKEKYADDPTRMNQELMGLYKKHGVNPMAGCLPMFIQIPIFFGFYNMLGKAVALRNSPFLWVPDLSQPDTVAIIAGFPVNVLPLLMAITMLVQMQLTPKTGDPMQQRMFMFMPVIFVVFCYNYASGLALYWTVQNIFTIIQLLITNRNKRAGLQVL